MNAATLILRLVMGLGICFSRRPETIWLVPRRRHQGHRRVLREHWVSAGQSVRTGCWNGRVPLRCPLTGIDDEPLLRASHIVAWADCETDAMRLDVHNGLLLSALWDAAFDTGLVSFADDGAVLVSPRLTPPAAAALDRHTKKTVIGLTDIHRANLARTG